MLEEGATQAFMRTPPPKELFGMGLFFCNTEDVQNFSSARPAEDNSCEMTHLSQIMLVKWRKLRCNYKLIFAWKDNDLCWVLLLKPIVWAQHSLKVSICKETFTWSPYNGLLHSFLPLNGWAMNPAGKSLFAQSWGFLSNFGASRHSCYLWLTHEAGQSILMLKRPAPAPSPVSVRAALLSWKTLDKNFMTEYSERVASR